MKREEALNLVNQKITNKNLIKHCLVERIYNTAHSWYNDPAGGIFNAIIFASALNCFSQSTNSVLAAAPHSSAGGGGSGFGGGS